MANEPKDGVRRAAMALTDYRNNPEWTDNVERVIESNLHAREMAEALEGLLQMIETDDLVPESVSYMREARDALAKFHGTEGER